MWGGDAGRVREVEEQRRNGERENNAVNYTGKERNGK